MERNRQKDTATACAWKKRKRADLWSFMAAYGTDFTMYGFTAPPTDCKLSFSAISTTAPTRENVT